jgi:hypothetical protein
MALAELLARIEAEAGPDRELDGRIWCSVNGYEFVAWDGAGVVYRFREPGIRHMDDDHIQPVTRSVDSALALVERVLPGHQAGFQPGFACYRAQIIRIEKSVSAQLAADAKHSASAPLAILAACLRALIAKGGA